MRETQKKKAFEDMQVQLELKSQKKREEEEIEEQDIQSLIRQALKEWESS